MTTKKQKPLPSRWPECSPQQIQRALPLIVAIKSSEDATIILPLMDQLAEVLSGIDQVGTLPLLARHELYHAIAWALTEPFTERPFPYIRIGRRRYYLPLPHYADTSTIEVAMANIQYLAFSNPKAPNSDALYQLLATILRPRRWGWWFRSLLPNYDGDDREPYNSLRVEQRAKVLQKLTIEQIIAVLSYWENMNNAFVQRYEKLYEADPDARQLFQNGEGWISTIEDVAENRVHGNFDNVCSTNIHTIWLYLAHKKIKTDEQIRLREKQQEQHS